MAKKKGRRSINVARKREKRNRDRKSRQKQLAVEKQRRQLYEKSEEEHLHACISQSQQLLDEPELEGVLFDFELTYKWVTKSLSDHQVDRTDAPTDESAALLEPTEDSTHLTNAIYETVANTDRLNTLPEAERACEHFQLEVLPHLVTPDFMRRLEQALTACETRLKLTGDRELAEVASVTRSLFEKAPPEILAFHPMIQTIGIETLRVLVEEPDIIDNPEEVKEILSDVLEYEDSEGHQSQPVSVFSDAGKNLEHREVEAPKPVLSELASSHADEGGPESIDMEQMSTAPVEDPAPPAAAVEIPPVSLDELPARALYKNFNGLKIKEHFKGQRDDTPAEESLTHYALVNENEKQVEFVDVENERYITVTEERLQLHARSEAELTIAMAEVEARCTSAVMYLAKTIKERG
ncbi:MAG: hypothetical protein OXU27_09675 [Candidatus Poribacteria bacterium]|nr:hypothetical protein [Candidatus Poribacteria bacterium]